MPDFYKQYRFKDDDSQVQSWDQFLGIRIGARLIKDTGDEYEKVDENTFNKVNRQFLSNHDVEGKYALLKDTNIFTNPQFLTLPPAEPYHIVNKEYVDALVASASVDLSGFARLDRENHWAQPQVCNAEPKTRVHLTNKGYVDDRVNEIEFDTTALAKLNKPNVFTAPQSVTVPATSAEHLATKGYVDNTKAEVLNNISGFVRADLPNTFTATQDFQFKITVPEPKTDPEAANKLYVDTKVQETSAKLGNYATLDLENIFDKTQTFKMLPVCNEVPKQNYHLANKEYVDTRIGEAGGTPEGVAYVGSDNQWTARQNFAAGILVPMPNEREDAANKQYVDEQLKGAEIGHADTENYGTVKLLNFDKEKPESFTESKDIPTGTEIFRYMESVKVDMTQYGKLDANNQFTGFNNFGKAVNINGSITSPGGEDTYKVTRAMFDDDVITHGIDTTKPFGPERWPFSPDDDSRLANLSFNPETLVVKGGNKIVTNGTYGTPEFPWIMWPEVTAPTAIDFNGMRFGVTDLDSSMLLGTVMYVGAHVLEPQYDDRPSFPNIIGYNKEIDDRFMALFIGFRLKDKEMYAASNFTPSPEAINDELINAYWVHKSPYIARTVTELEVHSAGVDITKLAEGTDAYRELRKTCVDGKAKVKPNSVDEVLKLLDTQVVITSPMKNQKIKISCADIILKNLDNFTVDIDNSKVGLVNVKGTVNCVNSDVIVDTMEGTLNVSRRSHVFLKAKTDLKKLVLDAKVYSTIDDTDNQCKITVDKTSLAYSSASKPEAPKPSA